MLQGLLSMSRKLRSSLRQKVSRLLQILLRFPDHGMVNRPGPYLLPESPLSAISSLLAVPLSFGSNHLGLLLPNCRFSIIRRTETKNIALYFGACSLSCLYLEIIGRARLQVLQIHSMRVSTLAPWCFG